MSFSCLHGNERYRACDDEEQDSIDGVHKSFDMIVTTNIPLSVMQKAPDLDDRRIYDRILEVCVPILFDGENFRRGNAAENLKKAAQILNL